MSTMTPQQAKTLDQAATLQTDGLNMKEFWILLNSDGNVCIHKQRNGEETTQHISIPRRQFDAMVRWYLKPQKLRRPV